MSQATIALVIVLLLGSSIALWNHNDSGSRHHGGSSYSDGQSGSGNGGGGLIGIDPQQCS